jgi:hypothetical protein
MNKKILIGSIIAVAILVGVSLTSVVGYQSIDSNFKESPLFNVRSGRAIIKEINDVTCNYFGKGTGKNLDIPDLEIRTNSVGILLDLIKKMDDKTLWKFTYFVASRLTQNNNFQVYSNEDFYLSLKQLRDNPNNVITYSDLQPRQTHYISCYCPDTSQPIQCAIFSITFLLIMCVTVITTIFWYIDTSFC